MMVNVHVCCGCWYGLSRDRFWVKGDVRCLCIICYVFEIYALDASKAEINTNVEVIVDKVAVGDEMTAVAALLELKFLFVEYI